MPFALTIFLSAFLLFFVQLILGKFVLPWFGGAPAVWTTCMLFFQAMLLLGYAYAHLVATRLPPAKQARVHLGLLAGSLSVLGFLFWRWGSPILPSDFWKPEGPAQPVWQILKLLAISIGFPFFLLSATSPLLQQWSGRKWAGGNPYRLYALSNVGSVLGLVTYPFAIEPMTRLSTQARMWGVLYVFFAVACGVCAVNMLKNAKTHASLATPGAAPGRVAQIAQPRPERGRPGRSESDGLNRSRISSGFPAGQGAAGETPAPGSIWAARAQEPAPGWGTVALWLALTAITSAMFLSVTNNLCQDVAVVPLLWVLPLAIYLLSFIFCFGSVHGYRRGGFVIATAVATLVVLATASQNVSFTLSAQIFVHSFFLFLFCMACHGELVRLKPGSRHLTLFLLIVALGGVVGSVFVAVIAPIVFKGYWEFYLTLVAGWIVLAVIFVRDRSSFFHQGDRWQFLCLLLLINYVVLDFGLPFTPLGNIDLYWKHLMACTLAAAAVATLLLLALVWRRPLAQSSYWPRLLVGGVIFFSASSAWQQIRHSDADAVDARRNFYGVVRVVRRQAQADGRVLPLLQLTHGQVNHGIQIEDEVLRHQPVGYYSKDSGIELALRLHPRRARSLPLNIGVLGLGVGTIAAFAREGDIVRFYEINPAVIVYSVGPQPYFTYVRDCAGRAAVLLGDARLSLEREAGSHQPAPFDILVMDAFSGDAVPAHLLTKEAFETYLQHRRDADGIIAVNISNRYLDLRDLMSGLARHFGLEAVVIDSRGHPPDRTSSRWCLLTRNKDFVRHQTIRDARENYQVRRVTLWTDDFSNLFQLMH